MPVKREGNRVTVGSPTSPQGLTLRVSIKKIDDKPSSVTIMANNDKYTLPGDEYRLNRYLAREPEVAYHILRILSTHGVPVEYDAQTKTLKTTLTPEEDFIGSRTSIPNRSSSSPSSSTSHSASGGLVRPTVSSPKIIRIASTTYYLPEDWDRLKRDLQDGRISATSVMDVLDMQHIAAPGDIVSIIRTRISTSVGKVCPPSCQDETHPSFREIYRMNVIVFYVTTIYFPMILLALISQKLASRKTSKCSLNLDR